MPSALPWQFAAFRLDPTTRCLWRDDQLVTLPPKAFAVLAYLVAHADEVVTKEQLLAAVWPEAIVSEGVLKTCMSHIRRALGETARTPQYIATVHRRGYRFRAPPPSRAAPPASAAGSVPVRPGTALAASVSQGGARTPAWIVGRATELAQLQAHYARACQGVRQLVVVQGEAGVGKTALVDTFVAQVTATEDVWVGHGQCLDYYGVGEAYLPVLEALGRLGRGAEGAPLVAVLQQYAPSWLVHLPALLAPADWERLAHTARGLTPARMLRELAEALEVLTAVRPLVLILEDLHWSDRATLEWLAYVVRRRDPARLLILGTYRPADMLGQAPPLRPLLAELRQQPQCAALEIEALAAPAVAAYLEQRAAATPLPPGLAPLVHQRTSGHPLFMVMLVDELLRHQRIEAQADARGVQERLDAVTQVIPQNLRQFLEAQVERLPRADQVVLAAASVAGVEFPVAAVAAALEHAVEAVEARCAALAHQGQFLQPCDQAVWPDRTVTACYRFRHALYQEAVYQRIPPGRQARWHARIGLRLEHGFGAHAGDIAAALARHFLRGHLPQAVPYLQHAGQTATRRGAYQEAVTCYEQALRTLQQFPNTPDRLAQAIDLRLALNEALFPLGAYPQSVTILREAEGLAEALGDQARMGWVSVELSGSYRQIGAHAQAVVVAQRAAALASALGDEDLHAWSALRLGHAAYFLGDYPRASDCFRESIALARAEDEGESTFLPAHARSWLVYCLTQRGAFVEGGALGAEAIRLAEAGEFPVSRCAAYASYGHLSLIRGEVVHAIALLEQGLALCRRWHNLDWFPECATSLGLAYALAGRWADAGPLLEQMGAHEPTMGGGSRAIYCTKLGHSYLLAGRLAEARAQAERALMLAREHQERGFEAWGLWLLGAVATHGHRFQSEEAHASYQRALGLALELGMCPLQAYCHQGLGTLYALTSQWEPARAALMTSRALYQEMGMTSWLSQVEAALAQAAPR